MLEAVLIDDLSFETPFTAGEENAGADIATQQFFGHGNAGEEMPPRSTTGEDVCRCCRHVVAPFRVRIGASMAKSVTSGKRDYATAVSASGSIVGAVNRAGRGGWRSIGWRIAAIDERASPRIIPSESTLTTRLLPP